MCGIIHNDSAYYFLKNLQGDVIAITDNTGKTVATYKYDAWGKCTDISDTTEEKIASINPYRYRTYYYDTDTGFYYLNSRYYDPKICRFINADDAGYIVWFSIVENNLYCYCSNNPVNNKDISGNLSNIIVQKIASFLWGMFVGLVQQFLSDVFFAAYRRFRDKTYSFKFSSEGAYVSSAISCGWDSLWGGGFAVEICKAMISNIISQLIDMWVDGGTFSFVDVIMSAFEGIYSWVLDKIFKEPKFIRDIKDEARSLGIKGTKKLVEFLDQRIKDIKFTKFTFGALYDAIEEFVKDCIKAICNCAKNIYNELSKLFLQKKGMAAC